MKPAAVERPTCRCGRPITVPKATVCTKCRVKALLDAMQPRRGESSFTKLDRISREPGEDDE